MATKKHGTWLYISTLLIELIPGLARFLVAGLFIYVVFGGVIFLGAAVLFWFGYMKQSPWENATTIALFASLAPVSIITGIVFGVYPIVISVLALAFPHRRFFNTRLSLGDTLLSEREAAVVWDAQAHLLGTASVKIQAPTDHYVIDYPVPLAFTLGTSIYFTRNLITSPFLLPVLAHELGHLNSFDARLSLAVRSFTISWWQSVRKPDSQSAAGSLTSLARQNTRGMLIGAIGVAVTSLLSVSRSGRGSSVLKSAWEGYWQERAYVADQFAADCAQAAGLIEYLEHYTVKDISVPFLVTAEPSSESRISRLQGRVNEVPGMMRSETMQALPRVQVDEKRTMTEIATQQNAGVPTRRGIGALMLIATIAAIILLSFFAYLNYNHPQQDNPKQQVSIVKDASGQLTSQINKGAIQLGEPETNLGMVWLMAGQTHDTIQTLNPSSITGVQFGTFVDQYRQPGGPQAMLEAANQHIQDVSNQDVSGETDFDQMLHRNSIAFFKEEYAVLASCVQGGQGGQPMTLEDCGRKVGWTQADVKAFVTKYGASH